DKGNHTWAHDENASRPFYERELEAGINFFYTAKFYSAGTSEEFLGRAMKDLGANRDSLVIATKVHGAMGPGPNQRGLSRKAILQEIDNSLDRLQMDYVDLYQIHRLDPYVPMEEILEALDDVVSQGKARYIGASSMYAWQFAKLLYLADLHGFTRFASMQNHVNLLYREEEREMIPLCRDQGIGVIPWSPLARGRLAREWDTDTERSETDQFGSTLYLDDSDRRIVEAVGAVAKERGVSRAQIALAWHHAKPGITAPIVGATKIRHLDDALASLDIEMTDEEKKRLEEPYRPHAIAGHG
ncbi:MAG: aldo/keto reductase, partial [Parasphingopyxis sp.]|uniref:aldo/keto reductase n=1 Tax=Parasphingopyxis sp. TaxID=1920299 RepID=UPI0032EACFF3